MPIVPINLPPGIYANGTPYSRKNRWAKCNFLRWHNGSMRPIGGWERRKTIGTGTDMPGLTSTDWPNQTARDAHAWRLNNGDKRAVFGTNKKVFLMTPANSIVDVTPTATVISSNDTSIFSGYGIGAYGVGPYGVENQFNFSDIIGPTRWSFDNFGQSLLAMQRGVGGLYVLDAAGSILLPVAGSPVNNADFIHTDERITMVIGDSGNARRVKWSDQESITTWTPAVSNQAGDYLIPGQGDLLRCVNVGSLILIVSETDAYTAQYVGAPFIWSFAKVGDQCGPVDASTVISLGSFAVWLGAKSFWIYDGTTRPLPCDVIDYIMEDADQNKWSKSHVHINSAYAEVWWKYQSTAGEDVDSYVVWNYVTNTWFVGKLSRTVALDVGVMENVIMLNRRSEVWVHEQDYIYPLLEEGTVYAETGPLELGEGEQNMAIRYVFLDTQDYGGVKVKFKVRQMPTEPEYVYGPFNYQNPISPRIQGREIRMRIEGMTRNFEFGTPRFDIAPMGGGRR